MGVLPGITHKYWHIEADFRSVNLTSEVIFFCEIVRVTSSVKAFFEVVGVSSQKSKCFALYEIFSDPVRVTGREMRVLKRLCRIGLKCGRMSRIPWL